MYYSIFNDLRTREGNRKVYGGPSLMAWVRVGLGAGLTEVRADSGAGLSWVRVDSKLSWSPATY